MAFAAPAIHVGLRAYGIPNFTDVLNRYKECGVKTIVVACDEAKDLEKVDADPTGALKSTRDQIEAFKAANPDTKVYYLPIEAHSEADKTWSFALNTITHFLFGMSRAKSEDLFLSASNEIEVNREQLETLTKELEANTEAFAIAAKLNFPAGMAQGLGYKCLRNTFMLYKMSTFMSPHMFDRSLDFQGGMEDAKFLALIHTITGKIPLLSEAVALNGHIRPGCDVVAKGVAETEKLRRLAAEELALFETESGGAAAEAASTTPFRDATSLDDILAIAQELEQPVDKDIKPHHHAPGMITHMFAYLDGIMPVPSGAGTGDIPANLCDLLDPKLKEAYLGTPTTPPPAGSPESSVPTRKIPPPPPPRAPSPRPDHSGEFNNAVPTHMETGTPPTSPALKPNTTAPVVPAL